MTAPELTVRDEEYRWPVRALNAAASVAETIGLPIGRCDAASIKRAAIRSAGHSDWGSEDFVEPMDCLTQLVSTDPRFTPLARVIMRQTFLRALTNRLDYQAFIKRHPDVLDQQIKAPIFVLGFPRTGTTALQNLLCLDPRRRGLKLWELATPVPCHENPTIDRRKRVNNADWMLWAADIIAPEQRKVHYMDTETYEECWPLFGNTFRVLNYDLQSGLTPYGQWLLDHDMRTAYAEYLDYLKLLMWRNPVDNLVLKCPEHLWFIDALLETFPDACIVWTHRDPVPTIASYCSLISMQWRTLYGGFDPHDLGDHITGRFHQGITRALEARKKANPERFFDVNFSNFVTDQAGTVRSICEYFHLPYRDGMDGEIATWLENDRADHRGAHKYSVERYGIDPAAVYEMYGDYIEAFSIKTKRAKYAS